MAYFFMCKRWFQRGPGNTYHSVRIFRDGEEIAYVPYAYGYGDQCLQTGLDKLREMGEIPPGKDYGTRFIREELKSGYEIIDVNRKKDL
jgi:hypothetical protein